MIDVATILDRLERVRKGSGADKWMASCPAHDDRGPSLSIRVADDGRILLYCFAGCDINAVTAALGLRVADLMPEDTRHSRPYLRPGREHPTDGFRAADFIATVDYHANVILLLCDQARRKKLSRDKLLLMTNSVRVISEVRLTINGGEVREPIRGRR